MMGNSSEIKLIANDELMHVAFTTRLIRTLPEDDPEFKDIREDCKEESYAIFMDVLDDEKRWAKYVFSKGSTLGLNEQIAVNYLDEVSVKRMKAIGLVHPDEEHIGTRRSIPWMSKWLNEGEMQVAPQETEVTSYVQNIQNTMSDETFGGIDFD